MSPPRSDSASAVARQLDEDADVGRQGCGHHGGWRSRESDSVRAMKRNVYDRMRVVRRAVRPIEAAQVRHFGRSIVSLVTRTSVLLLHTTGRRSGLEVTTPLAYHEDTDGSLLIVGGAGGQARIPDWVSNLRAEPTAWVTLDKRRVAVVATELGGQDRSDVWQQLTVPWPRIDTYERRAGRLVPVFRLRRTHTGGP